MPTIGVSKNNYELILRQIYSSFAFSRPPVFIRQYWHIWGEVPPEWNKWQEGYQGNTGRSDGQNMVHIARSENNCELYRWIRNSLLHTPRRTERSIFEINTPTNNSGHNKVRSDDGSGHDFEVYWHSCQACRHRLMVLTHRLFSRRIINAITKVLFNP